MRVLAAVSRAPAPIEIADEGVDAPLDTRDLEQLMELGYIE